MTYEKLYGENKEKTLEVLNNALINLFPGSKFSLDLNVLRNLQSTKMNIQNKYNDAPNIDEFNEIGGQQVINRMEIHLEESIKNKKRIDNLLKRRY